MAMSVVYTNFGGMLVHEDRGGTERQYVSDTLGSLIGELDSTQATTYTADYWPYGEVQTETGSNTSSWNFVGLLGYLSDLACLLYVRARHYLSAKARWLTVDPLWPSQLPYIYVASKPTMFADSSGLLLDYPWGCGANANLYIYRFCNGCRRIPDFWERIKCFIKCHKMANEYYRRCKGIPGPGFFGPTGTGGQVVPCRTDPCSDDVRWKCSSVGWGHAYPGGPPQWTSPTDYFDVDACKNCCKSHLQNPACASLRQRCVDDCQSVADGIIISGEVVIFNTLGNSGKPKPIR